MTRLVLVFASPLAQELGVLADRLAWPITLIDPDRGRLDSDPVPYARCELTVAGGRIDDTCDVVVTDHHRDELGDVLAAVLATPARWVGIVGNPRHIGPHIAALQERGVDPDQIARVQRPIGLDIGSRTPAEIAIATVAGLVAVHHGREGGFLRAVSS